MKLTKNTYSYNLDLFIYKLKNVKETVEEKVKLDFQNILFFRSLINTVKYKEKNQLMLRIYLSFQKHYSLRENNKAKGGLKEISLIINNIDAANHRF